MTPADDGWPCPNCGHVIPVTQPGPDEADQIASDHVECPSCGAQLVHAVEGHADHGWRAAGAEA